MKAEYVRGAFLPGIDNFDGSTGLNRVTEDLQGSVDQGLFATGTFRQQSMPRHAVVLIGGETKAKKCVWVGRDVMLCRVNITDSGDMEI